MVSPNCQNGRIDVAREALPAGHFSHLPQQLKAVSVLVEGVVIREVFANVATAERAEQRIHDRVSEDVGVGMSLKPLWVFMGSSSAG